MGMQSGMGRHKQASRHLRPTLLHPLLVSLKYVQHLKRVNLIREVESRLQLLGTWHNKRQEPHQDTLQSRELEANANNLGKVLCHGRLLFSASLLVPEHELVAVGALLGQPDGGEAGLPATLGVLPDDLYRRTCIKLTMIAVLQLRKKCGRGRQTQSCDTSWKCVWSASCDSMHHEISRHQHKMLCNGGHMNSSANA